MRRPPRPLAHRLLQSHSGAAEFNPESLELRPDQVLVESFEDDLRGATFIKNPMVMIPSMFTEPSRFAKVIAIGSLVRQNGDVKIGDTILCNRYPKSAQPFPWDQRHLCLVREDDLLARVTEE